MFKKTLMYLLTAAVLMTSTPVNVLADALSEEMFSDELSANDEEIDQEIDDEIDEEIIEEINGAIDEDVPFISSASEGDEEVSEYADEAVTDVFYAPEDLIDDELTGDEMTDDSMTGNDMAGENFGTAPLSGELSSTETVCPEGLADSDELYAEYVNRLFYGHADDGHADGSVRKQARGAYTGLTGNNQIVFEALRDAAVQIASGNRVSTVVTITREDLGVDRSYTAADLGVASLTDENGNVPEETMAALIAQIQFDSNIVVDYLMARYPYELYWFDKAEGIKISCNYNYDFTWPPDELYFSETNIITIRMPVSENYAGDEPFTVDTAKTKLADTACANAHSVVEQLKSQSLSDLDRLTAYKNYITDKVTYNKDAANDDNEIPYGNPWQLIWVFDEDPTTNVVCEGYAKAFKYLCDITGSDFNESIECCLITGNVTGVAGEGSHMWNIVIIAGSSYLADITNSDDGTPGSGGQLFMAGADGYLSDPTDGSFAGYYVKISQFGSEAAYLLDADNFAIYDPEILKISDKSYAKQTTDPDDSSADPSSGWDSLIDDMDDSSQDEVFTPVDRSIMFPDAKAAAERAAAGEAARKAAEAARFTLNVKNGASVPVALGKNNKNIHVVKLGDGDSLAAASSAATAVVSAKLSGSSIVLKGLKPGKSAKVTVTTQYGGSVTFTVKVQKKGALVKTKSIKMKTTTLRVGETFDVTTSINPVTTPDKMKFTLDKKGKKVISVSKKGIITARKAGTAKLTIQCGGKKKTVTVKVVG